MMSAMLDSPGKDGTAEAEAAMPAGWEIVTDEDANEYYYNRETGESQWDHPGQSQPELPQLSAAPEIL